MQPINQQTIEDFLSALAAKTPSPGGGATASVAGALAAAQAEMVVAYSIGKPSLEEHRDKLDTARQVLVRSRDLFVRLAEEDAAAYALVAELNKLPDDTPRKQEELPVAMIAAVQTPLSVLAAAADLLRLLDTLVPITNKHLVSDLAVSSHIACAAAESAACNVRVNLPSLDGEPRTRFAAECDRILGSCASVRDQVVHKCGSGG